MEPKKLTISELVTQLDFYFSPINFNTDRYLRGLVLDAEREGGTISLEKIHNFQKISQNSREELTEAVPMTKTLKLADDGNAVTLKTPFALLRNIRKQIVFVFNPAPDSTPASLHAKFPGLAKVGCKRDNTTQEVYGAKLYFASEAEAEAFLKKERPDGYKIAEEMDKSYGLAAYEDYRHAMREETEKAPVLFLSGLGIYDLKHKRNELRALVKADLLAQGVPLRNVVFHGPESETCLVTFANEHDKNKALEKEGLTMDGSEVVFKTLTEEEHEDALKALKQRMLRAGARRRFDRRGGGGRRFDRRGGGRRFDRRGGGGGRRFDRRGGGGGRRFDRRGNSGGGRRFDRRGNSGGGRRFENKRSRRAY